MKAILKYFIKEENNLEKNIELYEQKKKAEQQKSKVHGQKPVKQTGGKEKSTNVHNSSRL
tara:strand:- start:774 stop:953 length:180 start_codon:yes stop_codon:yes gene_type:complete